MTTIAGQPLELARRLRAAGLARVALLHDATPGGVSWLAAEPDAECRQLDPPAGAESGFGDVPEWIGAIPYEARRGLERIGWRAPDERPAPLMERVVWRRYPAVFRICGGKACVTGPPAASARLLDAARTPLPATAEARFEVSCDEPASSHIARICRARELIIAGDLYQVNVARRLDVEVVAGELDDAFARLVALAPNRFCALLSLEDDRHILSTSPELLLRSDSRQVATEPIKGTRPRGRDAVSDAALIEELAADPKECAELAMIIDVERNDVGSVCVPGSVRIDKPPHVVTTRTVHHRKALVTGTPRPGVTRADILAAMVPSGSVTGAPKIRAMEVTADLESHRRGLYTGGFGYVRRDGGVVLAMAIRTLVLRDDLRGHYWTGGGIVVDSVPEDELRETHWKARQLA